MSAAQRLPSSAASSFKAVRKYFYKPGPPTLRLPPLRVSQTCTADQSGARYLSKECEDAYKQLLVSELLKPASRNANETVENGEPSQNPGPPKAISDQEWEIRTGRAIYILQQTLPDFFSTGLVSTLNISGSGSSPSMQPLSAKSSWNIPGASWLGLGEKSKTSSGNGKAKEEDETEGIYSPRIRLTYTPPTPLPAPFPETLHAEGLHLYIASSIFLRHTLNALNTDLRVELRHIRVHGGQESGLLPHGMPPVSHPTLSSRRSRDKSVSVGLGVTGIGRVSGAPVEWQVNCTYVFSPETGHIVHHIVNSIEPAPHQALFEMLGKFGLLSGNRGGGGVGGVSP